MRGWQPHKTLQQLEDEYEHGRLVQQYLRELLDSGGYRYEDAEAKAFELADEAMNYREEAAQRY